MDPSEYLPIQTFDMDAASAEELKPLEFDLFVHLPLNQKYLLYRRRGQTLDPKRFQKLAEHNINNFFIKREDYQLFIRYVAQKLRDILSLKPADREKATKTAARSLMRSALTSDDPVVAQAMMSNLYDITSNIIESTLETSNLGSKRAFRALSELAQTGTSQQRHPVNVAAMAVLIAYGIGYTSEKTLYYMAVAALVHDIGLSKLGVRVSAHSHDPGSLTFEEKQELYRHPQLSIDILKARGLKLPLPVLTIIAQHHEFVNGKGYPLGLRGTQVNEMSQLLQIADELDDRILAPVRGPVQLKLRLHYLFEKFAEERRFSPVLLGRVRAIIL